MKQFSALFLASLVTLAIADGGKDKEKHNDDKYRNNQFNLTSDERSCHRLWKLSHIADTVSNTSRMAEIQRTSPERAQKLKEQATQSAPELQTLNGNQTLTKYCPVLRAHDRFTHDCQTLGRAEKLERKLKNETAVKEAARRKGRSDEEVKKHWQAELDSVKKMKENSTLVKSCGKLKDGSDKKKAPQSSDAAAIKVAGTGAFALGLGLYFAAILF